MGLFDETGHRLVHSLALMRKLLLTRLRVTWFFHHLLGHSKPEKGETKVRTPTGTGTGKGTGKGKGKGLDRFNKCYPNSERSFLLKPLLFLRRKFSIRSSFLCG